MEKKQFTDKMREQCRAPFPESAYKAIPGKTYLTTLKAFYVTERLNDVFGVGRWTIHTEVIEKTNDFVLLQGEFESRDYDITIPKQYGGHKIEGKGTDLADGFKSAFTDCQSKIASYLEIGGDMFKGLISSDGKYQGEKVKPVLVSSSDSYQKVLNALISGHKIEDVEKKYLVGSFVHELLKSDIEQAIENEVVKREQTKK